MVHNVHHQFLEEPCFDHHSCISESIMKKINEHHKNNETVHLQTDVSQLNSNVQNPFLLGEEIGEIAAFSHFR